MNAPHTFAASADRAGTHPVTTVGSAFAQAHVSPDPSLLDSPSDNLPVAGAFSDRLEITLPWPDKGLSPNARGSWRKRAQLVKDYRKACADAAWQQGVNPTIAMMPSAITFCPPGKHRHDRDNLTARFKAGQDGLADALGVDDYKFQAVPTIGAPTPGGAVRVTLSPIPG